MTSTGYLVLPLAVLLLWLPRAWSIPAIFLAAVLADAAVANPGGRPVIVGWFVALLLIGRVAASIAVGHSPLRLDILRRMLPLALFIAAAMLSLLLALAFFKGEVIVLPGSAELDPSLARPYSLTPENLNQLVYLGLVFLLVLALAHIAAELDLEGLAAWTDRAMRWSCGLAAAVVAWHVAWIALGVWFPAGFFHSSAHAGAWDQGILGLRRPSGPFPEPSALAYFSVMYLFYFWQRWRASRAPADLLWLLLALAMLLASTSTAGYVVLAAFTALAAIDALVEGTRRVRAGRPAAPSAWRLRAAQVAVATVVVATIGGAALLLVQNRETVDAVVTEQLRNKGDSISFELRNNADRMAGQIFLETYGIGMGLGSHRPSSGLLTLLAGTGVAGTLAMGWLLIDVLRRARAPGGSAPPAADFGKALRWAVIGLLLCHVLVVPELQSVPLWACIALAIALPHARAPAVAPTAIRAAPLSLARAS